MRVHARTALLLALLLLAVLLLSAVLPAVHTHACAVEHCSLCRLIFRAESLFRGLACAAAALGLCAAARALRCPASAASAVLPVSPVRLRVKLTN